MKDAFQDLLLFIPLNQLRFLTPLGSERIFYNRIEMKLPKQWLKQPTLVTLIEDAEIERLNGREQANQLIQDPNLVGIVICSQNSTPLNEENLTLFTECQLPIVQVTDPETAVLFQGNRRSYYALMSQELAGMMEVGLPNILSELAKGLNTPILYIDEHHQLLWQTGSEEELRDANRWLNIHQRELDSTEGFEFHPINIAGVIQQGLIVSAELVDWQRNMVDKLVGLMALFLQTEGMFQEQQQKQQEHFVYDLLYHKFESKKVMVKQAKEWGWNLEVPHHLMLIQVEVSDELMPDLLNRMAFFLEELKPQINDSIIVFPFLNHIVILLEDGKERTIRERTQYVVAVAEQMGQKLSGEWPQCQFSFGIGKWYEDTTFLNKSYQEANQALRFGQNWFENRNVFHINDIGVLRLLIHIHQEILSDFSDEYLSALIESDREHGTDFINTLKAYIQYQGVITDVSDALYVHPNTLRNRIKRIEEIVGIDLQNPEEFMNLMVALKIRSFIYQ